MLWVITLLISVAAGWFLARTLVAGAFGGPRWASFVVELSLGVLFGPGLASVLYFVLIAAGAARPGSVVASLGVLLAVCIAVWWKFAPAPAPSVAPSSGKFKWIWVLWVCVALGFVFFFLDFQTASAANPNGEWDAMSIWNLRARYLAAGGDFWHRAVSADLGGHMAGAAHPGYPLFLSGFIALQWNATGTFEPMAPIAASFLIGAGAFLLLGSSLACRKSPALGLLAWAVLLASEVFASQTSAQYSDLLEGLAFLSSLVLLDAAGRDSSEDGASPRLLIAAGLAAGFAGWIKNEGLPFTIAALAVAAWKFRPRALPWVLLGAAPGVLATAVLKLFVAQGREAILPQTMGEAVTKIAGAGRWWQAALGFGKAIYDAGNLWTHPVLLAAVLAFALRFIPTAERKARLWLWIPLAVTAAAEYGLYLVTTADLNWHISTSVSRLVAQLWPSLIWLFFLTLRTPEEYMQASPAPVAAAPIGNKPVGNKARRR